MVLIDSNALIILLLGIMDKKLINTHKTTSIYEIADFENLVNFIGDLSKLLVIPNVWTEVDNLLNSFSGTYRYKYLQAIKQIIVETSEKYLESQSIILHYNFEKVGLTDSILIEIGKECDCLITSDSLLSDLARANGILIYDMIERRNKRLYKN